METDAVKRAGHKPKHGHPWVGKKVITFRDVDNDDDLYMITEHQFTCYAPKVR